MGRGRLLLATLTSVSLLMNLWSGVAVFASGGSCGAWGGASGDCALPQTGASVGNGGVDVRAGRDEVTLGRQGSGSGSGSGGERGGSGGSGLPNGVKFVSGGVAVDQGDAATAPLVPPRRGSVTAPAVPACQPQTPCDPDLIVRVSDLVSIPAEHPTQGMEPDGWLVVGVPTNFFATASSHVHAGPLLGAPAEVRFTPVEFRWDYGDGTSRTSATGGGSWASLGLVEFSETPTSHIFDKTGTLSIGLTVSYAAEFRFAGGDWRPVLGLVAVPTGPISAIADRAGTVLVADNCSANPEGPGC